MLLDDSVLPWGMTWDCPAFERACALARTLLGAPSASIVIVSEGRVLRSADPEGKLAPVGGSTPVAIQRRKTVWTDDCRALPEAANHPMVVGPPFIRFSAAAPIFLSDGSVLGALAVFGPEPKAFDAELKARLEDLAAFVADEADRARTAAELEARDQRLKRNESLIKALFEVTPVSLMVTDRDLTLIHASRQFFGNIGLPPEEVIGRSVFDLHPTFSSYRESYEQVLAGENFHAERGRWVDRDGSIRWLRSELAPVRDDAGEVTGMLSVSLDITDLVEALRRAKQAEARMNLACDLAELHVWEIDYTSQSLVTAGSSEATVELFGRDLTYEELAFNTNGTIHPDDRAKIESEWEKAVWEGRKFVPEYRLNRQDDKEVWAACSVQMTRDAQGKPKGMIGAMQNITVRKQAELALIQAKEEAEAANKAKSVFLATMSHEIRTPLNGVLGMAQAMAGEDLSEVQRERLSIIRQSGETLLAILNDVLDLSKIEAGKLELEEAEFDIEQIATGAHAAFTELANRKGLEFGLQVEPAARGVYLGDSTRVRQILYNLVSNAVKFTETGEVQVTVARRGEELVLKVADTGIGIEADKLARLFNKFEQADASTTRRFGGTGLGLSICRDLAGLMGGGVTARSELGKGTTFTAVLPLRRLGDSRPAAAPDAGADTEGLDAAELRVLAAEDNSVNQLVLRTLLHQAGIDPVIVGNGQEALEAWRDGEWDLILMDVQMPVMDGPTATGLIRQEEAARGRRRTPVIALTANAMAHQVAEYRACGTDDLVAKPIEIGNLFAVMERALDGGGDEAERIAS